MANNCQVNLAGKLLLVGDDEVPLVGQVRPVVNGLTRIVVRRTVAVPAMSEAIIPGKLKKCGEQRTWAVLESVANSKRNLLVARTLVDLSADDLPIRVMNLTNGYISLKKGTEIATCEPVACVRNLEHQPSKEEDSATIHKDKGGFVHLVDLYRRRKTFIGEGHKTQLIELLKEFQDMFSSGSNYLGSTSITTHKIDVGEAIPVKQRPRRLPIKQREESNKLIEEMRSQGVIERSQSPWTSPIVLVKKKDGSKGFCVDYRRLNKVTKRDSYPLPRVDTTLDAINGSRWFSTLDLKSGYWQVRMEESDKEKTAFTAGEGLWQFIVMPFGLSNTPATFERLMERVLQELLWTVCLIYLDDVIVHARTLAIQFSNLRTVFQRLREAGLKLNPKKCHLFQRTVRYLGHIVSGSGIAVDAGKTDTVSKWPEPKNKT
ncbi:Retrovirus-related Pol poly from transposon [Paramuricea clavata]|uniref:Retrovirus-related Pol poly from transposon n=1 Tax=Paramuricea clavata TaxID=317549 RepID=A0A7D9J2K1_PARCT|nr:Retrovirus-related Pol poly from transposon [Paramuricea clavata]